MNRFTAEGWHLCGELGDRHFGVQTFSSRVLDEDLWVQKQGMAGATVTTGFLTDGQNMTSEYDKI